MAAKPITLTKTPHQARALQFVRAVETVRGQGVYYYFNAGIVDGARSYVRLPDIAADDFQSRYDELLAKRAPWGGPRLERTTHLRLDSLYFVGVDDAVKIGRTTDIRGRLATMQTAIPRKLQLLAIAPGRGDMEREYHARFASSRMAGEWFAMCPEIASEIAKIRSDFPVENK